jgi:bacterial/archaeal transporter family-2 protein
MPPKIRPLDLLIATGTGALLTLMVLFNGALAAFTTPFFSSLAAHGSGTIAAAIALFFLGKGIAKPGLGRAPLWAYLGGISGAVTVMLTSITVNSVLALSGTLALGLAGQVVFGLFADRFGWLGLKRRTPTAQDLGALVLIVGGSLLIIFSGALT